MSLEPLWPRLERFLQYWADSNTGLRLPWKPARILARSEVRGQQLSGEHTEGIDDPHVSSHVQQLLNAALNKFKSAPDEKKMGLDPHVKLNLSFIT